MSTNRVMPFTLKFVLNRPGGPTPTKLADVELHFDAFPLEGMKLIGFAIWQSDPPKRTRSVTFPARNYKVNGSQRAFALLRPVDDASAATVIREVILARFAEWETAR